MPERAPYRGRRRAAAGLVAAVVFAGSSANADRPRSTADVRPGEVAASPPAAVAALPLGREDRHACRRRRPPGGCDSRLQGLERVVWREPRLGDARVARQDAWRRLVRPPDRRLPVRHPGRHGRRAVHLERPGLRQQRGPEGPARQAALAAFGAGGVLIVDTATTTAAAASWHRERRERRR